FERHGNDFKAPGDYPRRALVAWSTHDLPTFAGWWRGDDLAARERLGLLDAGTAAKEREERRHARAGLVAALRREGLVGDSPDPGGPLTDEIAVGVQAYAARSPAAVMVVQMEDVLQVAEQANLPGTTDQHPNWRRKLALPVEAWARDPHVRRVTRTLAAIR